MAGGARFRSCCSDALNVRDDPLRDAIRERLSVQALLREAFPGRDIPESASDGWGPIKCPFHDDQHASASVSRRAFKCHSCDAKGDIFALWMRIHPGSGFREAKEALAARAGISTDPAPSPHRKAEGAPATPIEVARWEIKDTAGAVQAIHVRREPGSKGQPKDFLWLSTDGSVTLHGRPCEDLPLYRSEKLKEFDPAVPVALVEGEKCADALAGIGVQAVGTVTGASSCPNKKVLGTLTAFHVVLWADFDVPGRAHMRKVAKILEPLAASVKEVKPPKGAPEGWDAGDVVAERREDGASEETIRDEILGLIGRARTAGSVARVWSVLEVVPMPVEWLWPDRIPFGCLTLLDGDPGVGKSTVALDIAARLSRGDAMPDGRGGGAPSCALILSVEDDPGRVIRPRLELAGADLSRIKLMDMPRDGEEGPPPMIPTDLGEIEKAITREGIRLVVLDPLMALLDAEVNTWRDQDVRQVLAPLAAVAQKTGTAVLMIRHLTKGEGTKAIYRGGGSIGIAGAARSVLMATDEKDSESGKKLLSRVKCNLGPPVDSAVFRLVRDAGLAHCRVVWDGTSPVQADDLLSTRAEDREERGAREEAREFLLELLAAGPVKAKEAQRQAKEAGISPASLRRVKTAAGVMSRKGFVDGEWTWTLPGE